MSPIPVVRSTCAALVIAVIAAIVAQATEAQTVRPTQKGNAAAAPTNPVTTAIAPEVLALKTSSDLTIKDLGFNGQGQVSFVLMNRGDVPINPSDPAAGRSQAVPENKQIKMDVYLGNSLLSSVYQARLAGKTSKSFKVLVPATQTPRCAESRALKAVVDPHLVIVELYDTNNTTTLTAARPCPDLAIQSIEKNWNDLKTEYVGRVTLVNNGNAVAESFEYMSGTGNNSHFTSIPDFGDETGGPLAPGETMKYNMGSAFAYEKMNVWVWIDRRSFVAELDETNNQKEKTLD